MRLRLVPVLPLLIALLVLPAFAGPAAAAPKAAPDEFTPVVANVVHTPEPVLASDGHIHLAYELLVVNRPIIEYGFVPAAAAMKRIQVLDERGKALLTLSGKKLARLTDRFGTPEPGTKLEPGQSGFVAVDVTLPRGAKVPSRLTHRIPIALHPDQGVEATTYDTAPSPVVKHQAQVLAPPVSGPGWIVNDGCCATLTTRRRGVLPIDGAIANGGRFSINLVRIQPNGEVFPTPPRTTADYSSFPYFGEPVHAVAAGTVVSAVDNLPETPLGTLPPANAADIGGNQLIVKIAPHRYVDYGLLQTGSILVAPGQKVKTGQVVAQIGSSGYTTGPQLHVGLLDGPRPLGSEGIPFRFSRFSVAGTLTNYTGIFEGKPARIRPELVGEHRKEMPLDNQVLSFP